MELRADRLVVAVEHQNEQQAASERQQHREEETSGQTFFLDNRRSYAGGRSRLRGDRGSGERRGYDAYGKLAKHHCGPFLTNTHGIEHFMPSGIHLD